MDHYQQIYARRADAYQHMTDAEDVDGSILPAIQSITPVKGRRVLDLGSGTGRLAWLLSPLAGEVAAMDLSRAMLREQALVRTRMGGRWPLAQGDLRALPFRSGWSDITTAGWAIGHLRRWYAPQWQTVLGRVIDEMERVTAPGGAVIILETLTTGSLAPAPPSAHLAEYYAWLEGVRGFSRQQIRTDFQFASVEEAVAATEFFFGPELSTAIRQNRWARLPEWTGVWSRVISPRK